MEQPELQQQVSNSQIDLRYLPAVIPEEEKRLQDIKQWKEEQEKQKRRRFQKDEAMWHTIDTAQDLDGGKYLNQAREGAKNLFDDLNKELEECRNKIWLHIKIEDFQLAIEVHHEPETAAGPVAIGSEAHILSVNAVARAQGVREQMNGTVAREGCPNLRILPRRVQPYREASEKIRDELRGWDIDLDVIGDHEWSLDLSSYRATLNSTDAKKEFIQKLRKKVNDASHPYNFDFYMVMAPNSYLAQVGIQKLLEPDEARSSLDVIPDDCISRDWLLLEYNTEVIKWFMGQHRVSNLPGLHKDSKERLELLRISTCQQLEEAAAEVYIAFKTTYASQDPNEIFRRVKGVFHQNRLSTIQNSHRDDLVATVVFEPTLDQERLGQHMEELISKKNKGAVELLNLQKVATKEVLLKAMTMDYHYYSESKCLKLEVWEVEDLLDVCKPLLQKIMATIPGPETVSLQSSSEEIALPGLVLQGMPTTTTSKINRLTITMRDLKPRASCQRPLYFSPGFTRSVSQDQNRKQNERFFVEAAAVAKMPSKKQVQVKEKAEKEKAKADAKAEKEKAKADAKAAKEKAKAEKDKRKSKSAPIKDRVMRSGFRAFGNDFDESDHPSYLLSEFIGSGHLYKDDMQSKFSKIVKDFNRKSKTRCPELPTTLDEMSRALSRAQQEQAHEDDLFNDLALPALPSAKVEPFFRSKVNKENKMTKPSKKLATLAIGKRATSKRKLSVEPRVSKKTAKRSKSSRASQATQEHVKKLFGM